MRTVHPRAALAALAALLLAAGTAHAQPAPRDTSPVPRELVELLFGRYGFGMRDIVVGRAPSGLPAGLEPEHVRAVGGMGGPMGGEAVYEVGRDPGAAAAALVATLEGGGWERYAPRPMGAMRGFVGSGMIGGPTNQFCKDRSTVTVAPHRQFDRSYLRVTWTVAERNPCRMLAEQSEGQRMMEQRYGEIPSLSPPGDMEVQGSGTSTSGDGWSVSARATGERTAVQLLDHYVAEMKAAGWTQATRQGDATLAIATFTRVGAERQSWYALLTVMPEPGQARAFALDLRGRRAGAR